MTSRSRSAMLVAACRLLADESPIGSRLCRDPYAELFVDDRARSAARDSPALARSVWLRTRYIDDAVTTFVHDRPLAQVLVLGAGNDTRSIRLGVDRPFFEIDQPDTVAAKDAVLVAAGFDTPHRTALALDLAAGGITAPLTNAGFDPARPTVAVWEGVTMYLTESAVRATIAEVASVLAPGSRVVVDYVPARSFVTGFQGENVQVGSELAAGGEPLATGVDDLVAVLGASGFEVIDDMAVEELMPRYGLPPVDKREMPLRILTAVRR